MAELSPMEKLQPCLLDRLTDDEPTKRQEHRSQRVMGAQKFRQAVIRDLTWLLNTYADAGKNGFDEFEQIPSSVLNFGVQNAAGMSAASLDGDDLRFQLTEALQRFEPRIIPGTISIVITVDPDAMHHRAVRFEIRGDLWMQPIPESLFIRTELDLETGKCKLNRG